MISGILTGQTPRRQTAEKPYREEPWREKETARQQADKVQRDECLCQPIPAFWLFTFSGGEQNDERNDRKRVELVVLSLPQLNKVTQHHWQVDCHQRGK